MSELQLSGHEVEADTTSCSHLLLNQLLPLTVVWIFLRKHMAYIQVTTMYYYWLTIYYAAG